MVLSEEGESAPHEYAKVANFVFIDNAPAKLLPGGLFHPVNQFGPGVRLLDVNGLAEPVDDKGYASLVPGERYTTAGGKTVKLRPNGSDTGIKVVVSTWRSLVSEACDDASTTDESRIRICDEEGDQITSLSGLEHNQVVYWCIDDEPFILPRNLQRPRQSVVAPPAGQPDSNPRVSIVADTESEGAVLSLSPRKSKIDLPDSPMTAVPLIDIMESSGLCYPRLAPNIAVPDLMSLRERAVSTLNVQDFINIANEVFEMLAFPSTPSAYRLPQQFRPEGHHAVITQRLLELLFQVDREPVARGTSKGRFLNTVRSGADHKTVLKCVALASPFLTKSVVPVYIDYEKTQRTLSEMAEEAFQIRGRPLPARGMPIGDRLRYTSRVVMVFADEVQLVWTIREADQAKQILNGFELTEKHGWCEQMFVSSPDATRKHSVMVVQIV